MQIWSMPVVIRPPGRPDELWAPGTSIYLNPRMPDCLRERMAKAEIPDLPEHIWIATSGTSGSLKLVALGRVALEASAAAVNRHLGADASDCWLNPLPLFHVGGLGIMVRAQLTGSRCEFLENWNAHEFARRAASCSATLSALVPAQVLDLLASRLRSPQCLRAIVVGGGALEESLRKRAADLGWPLLPSYGMTETSSQIATAKPGAEDFFWLPLLDHIEARTGPGDVLELRGASLLTGWMLFELDGTSRWEDPKIDGWFRTSDRAELRDGKLRFLGRVDDLVKIRGELVEVAALEKALQALVPSGLVRIDAESDERNGARLIVVADNADAEREAREAHDVFPPYARPASFRLGPVAVSPLGKKIRS